MIIKPQFITIRQAAELLAVSQEMVYKLIYEKKIKPVIINQSNVRRCYSIPVKEIERLTGQKIEAYSDDFIEALADKIAERMRK